MRFLSLDTTEVRGQPILRAALCGTLSSVPGLHPPLPGEPPHPTCPQVRTGGPVVGGTWKALDIPVAVVLQKNTVVETQAGKSGLEKEGQLPHRPASFSVSELGRSRALVVGDGDSEPFRVPPSRLHGFLQLSSQRGSQTPLLL